MTETFLGYERPDGSAGIRNYMAVIPSVACANGVVAVIALTCIGITVLLFFFIPALRKIT
jgi:altronate dehydratase large subunit